MTGSAPTSQANPLAVRHPVVGPGAPRAPGPQLMAAVRVHAGVAVVAAPAPAPRLAQRRPVVRDLAHISCLVKGSRSQENSLISHLSRSVLVELGQPVCEGAGGPLITAVRVTELLTQHHLHRLAGARPGRSGILHDDENKQL